MVMTSLRCYDSSRTLSISSCGCEAKDTMWRSHAARIRYFERELGFQLCTIGYGVVAYGNDVAHFATNSGPAKETK